MILRAKTVFMILMALLFMATFAYADVLTLSDNNVTIMYERQQEAVAREFLDLYPSVRDDLSGTLGMTISLRPTVLLVADTEAFRKMVGTDMVVAYAMPRQGTMVFDTVRTYVKPFSFRTTLEHELCHLAIHQPDTTAWIPRWFDEGVCQWASGGIAELVPGLNDRALARAVIADRVWGLSALETFPRDGKSLALAYEESLSFIEFVVREYGKEGIQEVLHNISLGMTVEEAFRASLSRELVEVEAAWHESLRKKYTWTLFVSRNIYEILFSLAGVVTLIGFARVLWRKRRQRLEEEEEDDWY